MGALALAHRCIPQQPRATRALRAPAKGVGLVMEGGDVSDTLKRTAMRRWHVATSGNRAPASGQSKASAPSRLTSASPLAHLWHSTVLSP
jgi:hypothetical protein